MLILIAALAGACGTACLEADAAKAEAALAAVAQQLPAAIDDMNGSFERPAEGVSQWKAAAAEVAGLWARFRDARCDPVLLRFEGARGDPRAAATCRARISRTAASDLRLRYQLDEKGFGRRDVEAPETGPRRRSEDEGPCAHAPPAECDYCGINKCWEVRLKGDDGALNVAWRRALARIAAAPGLAAPQRSEWKARLLAGQRLWLRWRDANCALEAMETPNPFAHSIYSLVTGPCLAGETEARTAYLRRTYGG